MKRNALALMLISTLLFSWMVGGILLDTARANFGPVPENKTIYIRSNGNVEPSTATIKRNGNTYILTEDIVSSEMGYLYSLEIQRDNIELDGSGHTLQGVLVFSLTTVAVTLKSRSNVTLKNISVQGYSVGFKISDCTNCIISENSINPYESGIQIQDSNQNVITKNNISNYQYTGIQFSNSNNNVLAGNNIRLDDNYPYMRRWEPRR
jgi:parallel beta-helix repeat protein